MNACLRSLGLCLLLAACGEDAPPGPQEPTLPPPQLAPFLPTLKELAAALPVPDEVVQRELNDLAEVALRVVEADARLEARATRSLLEHRDAWVALETALTHEDIDVRRRAAWLCGQTGQTALQLPLLLRLKYESDPESVVWVACALEKLGNDAGLLWLDAAMTREATAQTAGTLAIEICKSRGVELTEQPTYDELRAAMQALDQEWRRTGVSGRPGIEPPSGPQLDARVAKHLATPENKYMRPIDDARFVLTRAGKVSLPLLVRTLGASEAYLRTMALQILVELGPCAEQAGQAVMALLAEPMTALYAVRALGEIGYRDALPHLRPLLASIDTELRAAATQALGLLGDEQSRPQLTALMQDAGESMDVRVGAAFALCCLDGDDAAAKAFLAEREQQGDYHLPLLQQLRERLSRRGR